MLTRELRFTVQMRGSVEAVFDLVADMPHYDRWLPDSSAFGGTVNVTPHSTRHSPQPNAGLGGSIERTGDLASNFFP
jgi:uncharacterized protein YndB with AHSA1/START domain